MSASTTEAAGSAATGALSAIFGGLAQITAIETASEIAQLNATSALTGALSALYQAELQYKHNKTMTQLQADQEKLLQQATDELQTDIAQQALVESQAVLQAAPLTAPAVEQGFQMPLWGWIGIGVGATMLFGSIVFAATR